MTELFQRSCAHWSEEKRAEMEDFYALATADYRHLAAARDWRRWFEAQQRRIGERALRLLDVACGSGKFPVALATHAGLSDAAVRPIGYDLLDPSAFSLAEARSVLPAPFVAGASFEITLQELDAAPGAYDVVWATHALYVLPETELDAALGRFLSAMQGGVGVIAHGASDSHYIRFQNLFLDAFRGGAGERYLTAEALIEGLRRLGAEVASIDVEYASEAPAGADRAVEGFLRRCAFDDTVSLADMRAAAPLARYLAQCESASGWAFPQHVKLIDIRA